MVLYTICLVIVAVLSIILFFKVWGMCNDVKKLTNHFCGDADNGLDDDIKARILAGDKSASNEVKKKLVAELRAIAKKAQGMLEEDYVRLYGTSSSSDIGDVIKKYRKLYSEMGAEFPKEFAKVKTLEDLWDLFD